MPAENAAQSAERQRMVREQLRAPDRGITDARVLTAMEKVPRHRFVPEGMEALAYSDRPLPIGFEQTISQPFIVALMTQALALKPTDRVLEIGTGSGYQTAVLAELAAEVFTVEIVEPLATRAQHALQDLGYTNVHLRAGDGRVGWPEKAPFDAILAACAPEAIPDSLTHQLAEGARMILPIGGKETLQELQLLKKHEGRLEITRLLPVRFVPMTGTPSPAMIRTETHEPPTLLFDGVCHLCEASVQFVLRHEIEPQIRFAPIQSTLGRQLYSHAGLDPDAPTAMVFIDKGQTYVSSDAALRLARHLRGWPRLALIGTLIPRPLRERLYHCIATHRYRWFGKRDQCMMPDPSISNRFLG